MTTATITALNHTPQPVSARPEPVPAFRDNQVALDLPLTLRRATRSDHVAVARLAALDSAPIPFGPLLLAESSGELRAALSVTDGTVIADPFHPTAAIVAVMASLVMPPPARPGILRRLRRVQRGL